MQFLYLAPVGLVQTALDGTICMINPVSAQLLMPLSRDGNLTNLFAALEGVAPALRHLCADFLPSQGMVCDGMYIPLSADRGSKSTSKVLSLSVVKLGDARLMAVLSDVTVQVRRERAYSGQRDRSFRSIVTAAHELMLRGQILMPAVTMARYFSPF